MSSSGPIVSFEVCKHAARYNGLYEWLNNPPQVEVPLPGTHSIMQVSLFNPLFSLFQLDSNKICTSETITTEENPLYYSSD